MGVFNVFNRGMDEFKKKKWEAWLIVILIKVYLEKDVDILLCDFRGDTYICVCVRASLYKYGQQDVEESLVLILAENIRKY